MGAKLKKYFLILVPILFALTTACLAAEPSLNVKAFSTRKQFVDGEIIVKFRSAEPSFSISRAGGFAVSTSQKPLIKKLFKHMKNARGGFSVSSASNDTIDEAGVYKITVAGRQDVKDLAAEIKNDPNVEYAEPNYLYQTSSSAPVESEIALQSAMSKVGASSAWDVIETLTGEAVVAVIDTGVDYTHPALAQHIWANTKEIPNNGTDDDGNGYIDDIRGWNFVDVPADWLAQGEHSGPDNNVMDFLGHGTHVSGIIANLDWNCKIMPVRAGYEGSDGGGYLELSDIAEALHYAADNGADVINMSFGCEYDSDILKEAIDYAYSKGCVMVAAAGNVDSYDCGQPFYPAAYDHVIAVAAVDEDDRLAIWNLDAFSNFGTFVAICAPGTNILSTLPHDTYGYESGTSMASPFVAGVAAMLRSQHKDWTPEQVEARIQQTADNIYGLNPQSFLQGMLGAGRVNAKRAMGDLSLAITYPRPNSVLGGAVAVQGSASMEDFASYLLECSSAATPDTWTKIANSSSPVENGMLAIWNVSNPQSNYNLRLTVTNKTGQAYVYLSQAKYGTDSEVKLTGKPQCGPSPYDPNRDGDFLFSYYLLNAANVSIYVYDLTGTQLWRADLPYDPARWEKAAPPDRTTSTGTERTTSARTSATALISI